MSFFDFLRELRTGEPDVAKAAKALKVLGWVCLIGAVWNYVMSSIGPFDQDPFNLPPDFPYLALVSLSFLGGLFLLSGRGIKSMEPWGKKLAQFGVVLLVGLIIGFAAFLLSMKEFSGLRKEIPAAFGVFIVIFLAQFVLPAYFGIRYLGRLPVDDNRYAGSVYHPAAARQPEGPGRSRNSTTMEKQYKEALFPFGVLGTFALLLAVPLAGILLAEKFAGPEVVPFLFFPLFLLVFVGPALYNRSESSFEKERTPVATYTGGGSMFLFNGSWPFFRLLVYADGVEIRVMFHRFFIPYDKMDDLPEKIGFFSSGIQFKSNLPGVPASIRFYGFGSKRILEMVKEQRKRFFEKSYSANAVQRRY